MSTTSSNSKKIFSVFIKHPVGQHTQTIEDLLKECGPASFIAWKPQKDPSTGQFKNFGFAEFDDIEGFARAVRILSPIHFPDDDTKQPKQLLVRVDKNTTAILDVYNQSTIVNSKEDDVIRSRIAGILRERFGEATMDSASAFLDSVLNPSDSVDGTAESSKSNNVDENGDQTNNSTSDLDGGKAGDGSENSENVQNANGIDEEEDAKKRQERKLQEQRRIFEERLSKWESRENYRARLRQEHLAREKEYKERCGGSKEDLLKFLQEYDDDKEEEKAEDEWFTDRDRWIDRRKPIRIAEEQADERDRDMERRAGMDYRRKSTMQHSKHRSEQPPPVNKTMRISEFKDQLRRLLKAELEILNPISGKQDKDLIFKHAIDWRLLTKDATVKKIRPLVEAKITQFLGECEPDLVEFIMETVLPISKSTLETDEQSDLQSTCETTGKDPNDVLEEISNAFGDSEEEKAEAEDLMSIVWKAVIWECEKQKLAGGREIIGLDGSIEDLEINEVV